MDAASEDCNVRVPLPDHRGQSSLDDAAYERLVDLRECLLAQGYDVPEPPSAEAWKDSSLESAWNPYEAMFGGPAGQQIPQDELRSLMVACPQSGPTYYAEVPDYGS